MSNNHQSIRVNSRAKVICKQILPTPMEEINSEMNELIQRGYEPIKILGVAEKDISRICILMMKR